MFWPVPELPPVASFIAVCFNLLARMLPLPLLQRIAKSGGGNIKKNKKPAQTNKNGLSAQAQAQRLRLRLRH